jgi:hypothetical protein
MNAEGDIVPTLLCPNGDLHSSPEAMVKAVMAQRGPEGEDPFDIVGASDAECVHLHHRARGARGYAFDA